jgi:hypothetical protein
MPLSRCHVPKIARRAALDHMNGYDLENQSCGRDGSGRRRSTTALIGTGIREFSLLNTNRNVCSVATPILQRICLSTSVHSAHCRSMCRWMLDGSGARIWSTFAEGKIHEGIALLDEVTETWKVPKYGYSRLAPNLSAPFLVKTFP